MMASPAGWTFKLQSQFLSSSCYRVTRASHNFFGGHGPGWLGCPIHLPNPVTYGPAAIDFQNSVATGYGIRRMILSANFTDMQNSAHSLSGKGKPRATYKCLLLAAVCSVSERFLFLHVFQCFGFFWPAVLACMQKLVLSKPTGYRNNPGTLTLTDIHPTFAPLLPDTLYNLPFVLIKGYKECMHYAYHWTQLF